LPFLAENWMTLLRRTLDFLTLGSDRPIRRLVMYYIVLAVVVGTLQYFFPALNSLLLGTGLDGPSGLTMLLQDALSTPTMLQPNPFVELVLTTALALIGTLTLMLPVSWVYMSARPTPGHSQSVVQTLIILPIVVAGIVLIVRNSLALAFTLAGVVAAVRFRNTLRDSRDAVFIFLAIAVGFSAGVQTLMIGALLSVIFNIVLLLSWRSDFGRNMLTPTASSQWAEPLSHLAGGNGNGHVPDRDLVLALTPKNIDALAQRFERVRDVVGPKKRKPRYNALLSMSTDNVTEVQTLAQKVLEAQTKRWMLDEIVTNTGKPSEIYYLVRLRGSTTRDELLTALRAEAGPLLVAADLELADALEREEAEST
jgi:hypothetical protein